MISNQELKNLVAEWKLREDVIEKDYVIGWLLWGIGTDPDLSVHWAFKGGTARAGKPWHPRRAHPIAIATRTP